LRGDAPNPEVVFMTEFDDKANVVRNACGAAVAIALALTFAAAPAFAAEDPFGIPMGTPIAQLPAARAFKPGWYQVTPPNPDARFARVAVEAFRPTGVCVVQAVSPLIGADPEGTKVRAAIDRVAQAYSETLGQPEKLDSCNSMLCAPDLWAVDVLTGERHYGYRWRVRGGALRHVREVSVVVVAHSATTFTYLAEYQGDDLARCTAEEIAPD
jgi:hypothetical protein